MQNSFDASFDLNSEIHRKINIMKQKNNNTKKKSN